MGKPSVSRTVTNTGDGTVTAASVVTGPVVPMVGAYVLECTEAVTHGGVFKLEDPNGALVAAGVAMTAGDGVATVLVVGGLTFTVTDGAIDFIVGDKFTLTVATGSGKLVPFATDGVGGAQLPKAVLTYAVTATGAGDEKIRAMVSGTVRRERLVIAADGDASNVTSAILDQLRDYGIDSVSVTELNDLDNQ